MRVKGAVTRLLLLSCCVAGSIKVLSPSSRPDPEARPASSLHGDRGAARPVSPVSPVSVPVAPEPAALASTADEAAVPGPSASPGEPLAPDAELARLHTLLDGSGNAAGDALDGSSREIAGELVAQLRAGSAEVGSTDVECRAAGCRVTLEFASEDDYIRLHSVIDGTGLRSPLQRWPGSRIVPLATHARNGKLQVQIVLIRPDSTINFGA